MNDPVERRIRISPAGMDFYRRIAEPVYRVDPGLEIEAVVQLLAHRAGLPHGEVRDLILLLRKRHGVDARYFAASGATGSAASPDQVAAPSATGAPAAPGDAPAPAAPEAAGRTDPAPPSAPLFADTTVRRSARLLALQVAVAISGLAALLLLALLLVKLLGARAEQPPGREPAAPTTPGAPATPPEDLEAAPATPPAQEPGAALPTGSAAPLAGRPGAALAPDPDPPPAAPAPPAPAEDLRRQRLAIINGFLQVLPVRTASPAEAWAVQAGLARLEALLNATLVADQDQWDWWLRNDREALLLPVPGRRPPPGLELGGGFLGDLGRGLRADLVIAALADLSSAGSWQRWHWQGIAPAGAGPLGDALAQPLQASLIAAEHRWRRWLVLLADSDALAEAQVAALVRADAGLRLLPGDGIDRLLALQVCEIRALQALLPEGAAQALPDAAPDLARQCQQLRRQRLELLLQWASARGESPPA